MHKNLSGSQEGVPLAAALLHSHMMISLPNHLQR
jgi:hypothetical protein